MYGSCIFSTTTRKTKYPNGSGFDLRCFHQVRTLIAPKGFHTGRVDGWETPVEMEMAGVITPHEN